MTPDEIKATPFCDLLAALGLKQTELSRRFDIPLRTVQGWKLGERECPAYVRLMMAELCGLIGDFAETEAAIVELHNHYVELGIAAMDRMDEATTHEDWSKAGDDWDKALGAMEAIDKTCSAFGYKLVYDCPELGVGTDIVGIEKEG